MKIDSLTIKGITSFGQEVTINFNEILKDQSIFAITGATGSGKSTLLTAIFLALYGKSPKQLQRQELISLGQTEGFVELSFRLRGHHYMAHWSCKTHGRNGELKTPKIEKRFYRDGEPIEQTPEEVLQLSMDQFAKTIIINQGKFADFLTAHFSERRKILEKIYQTEEIGLISSTVKRTIKEIELEIQQIEAQIESGLLFNQEQFQEKIETHGEVQKRLKTKQELNQSLNPVEKLTKEIDMLLKDHKNDKKDIAKIENDLVAAHQEYQQAQRNWEQKKHVLESHKEFTRKVAPTIELLRETIEQKEQLTQQIHHSKKRMENSQRQLEGHQNSLKQTQKKSKELKSTVQNLKNELHQLFKQIFTIAAPNLTQDFDIEHFIYSSELADEIAQMLNQYQSYSEGLTHARESLSATKKYLEEIRSQGEQSSYNISEHNEKAQKLAAKHLRPSHKNRDLDDSLATLINQMQQKKESLEVKTKTFRQNKEVLKETLRERERHQKEITQLQSSLDRENASSQELQNKLDNARDTLQKYLTQAQQQQREKLIQQLRAQAHEQSSCPVCLQEVCVEITPDALEVKGLAVENNHNDNGDNKDQRELLEKDVEKWQAKLYHHREIIELKQKELAQKKETCDQLQKKSEQQRQQMLKDHPSLLDDADAIEKVEKDYENYYAQFSEDISKLQSLEQLILSDEKNLEKQRNQYQLKNAEYTKKKTELEQSEKSIARLECQIFTQFGTLDEDKSQQAYQKASSFTQELKKSWEELKEKHRMIHDLRHRIESLRPLIAKDNESITQTQQALQDEKEEHDEKSGHVQNLSTQLKNLQAELSEESLFSSSQKNSLKESQLSSKTIKELTQQLDSAIQSYEKQEEQARKLRQEADLSYNGLETRKEIKKQKLEGHHNLIISLIGRLKENLKGDGLQKQETKLQDSDLSQRMSDIQKSFKKIQDAPTNDLIEDSKLELISFVHHEQLVPLQETLDRLISQLREQAIELNTQIQAQKEKIKQQEVKKEQLKSWNEKLVRKQNLLQTLGQDEFSRFAMSFIEQQLLTWTNHELRSLCEGRYQLCTQTRNKNSGPEFFVIDHWKGSAQRHVNTLSGGETFLVSLAMALGLAELTKGQTEIETLIIDEGFGSLDQQAVEDALDILISISSRGKQIGVISHVKEMTQRIPINIQLNKGQAGESGLELIY